MRLDDFFNDQSNSIELIRAIEEASKSLRFENIIYDIEKNNKWNLAETAYNIIQKLSESDVREEFYNMLSSDRVSKYNERPVKEKIQAGNNKVWRIDWASDIDNRSRFIFAKTKQEAFQKFHKRFGNTSDTTLDGIKQIQWTDVPVRSTK